MGQKTLLFWENVKLQTRDEDERCLCVRMCVSCGCAVWLQHRL